MLVAQQKLFMILQKKLTKMFYQCQPKKFGKKYLKQSMNLSKLKKIIGKFNF